MFQQTRTLDSCLFSSALSEVIKIRELSDKQILGITQLSLNIVKDTAQAWIEMSLKTIEGQFPKLNYRGFDPNPGDGGCQKRGFLHLPSMWQ